jgi:hypothetical protein
VNTTLTQNLIVTLLAATMLTACGKKVDAPPPAAVNATSQPAPEATAKPGFDKLTGRWLRPDGGYVIEVRSVAPGGNMDASYFNPRPIHVAKAEASETDGTVKVFIELRDVNYPGSTYTLTYDPTSDGLTGVYFQAALKETYDVVFVRLKQ